MMPGIYTSKRCQNLNRKQLSLSRYKNLGSIKKRWKFKRCKGKYKDNKNKKEGRKCYDVGAS